MAGDIPPNIYDILMGSGSDAQAQARAMAALLRHQQDMQIQGATTVEGLNSALGQQAKQGNDLLEKAAVARMHYGPESLAAKAGLQQQKDSEALKRISEQVAGRKDVAEVPNFYTDPWGRILNKKTGRIVSQMGPDAIPGSPAGAPQASLKPGEALKNIKEFANKYNPGIASSRSQLGTNANVVNRGNRIIAQVESIPDQNLIPQEMVEATAQLVGMLVGTQAPAVRTIHEMTPQTLGGDLAKVQQWITGNPTGANQQAFVRRWLKTIKREQETAGGNIRTIIQGAIPAYSPYFKAMPDVAKKQLQEMFRGAGHNAEDYIDLDTFDIKQPGAAAAAGGKKVVRTGTRNGKKVVQYDDGSIEEQ